MKNLVLILFSFLLLLSCGSNDKSNKADSNKKRTSIKEQSEKKGENCKLLHEIDFNNFSRIWYFTIRGRQNYNFLATVQTSEATDGSIFLVGGYNEDTVSIDWTYIGDTIGISNTIFYIKDSLYKYMINNRVKEMACYGIGKSGLQKNEKVEYCYVGFYDDPVQYIYVLNCESKQELQNRGFKKNANLYKIDSCIYRIEY